MTTITVIGGAVADLAWVLLIVFALAAFFGGASRIIREIEGKARKTKARKITSSNYDQIEAVSLQRKIQNLEAAIRIQDSQKDSPESCTDLQPDINQDLYDQIDAAAKEYNATRANSSARLDAQRSQELDVPETGVQSEDLNIERGTD